MQSRLIQALSSTVRILTSKSSNPQQVPETRPLAVLSSLSEPPAGFIRLAESCRSSVDAGRKSTVPEATTTAASSPRRSCEISIRVPAERGVVPDAALCDRGVGARRPGDHQDALAAVW